MSDPTHFTNAILRHPADSAINGLRAIDRGDPDVPGLRREHAAYRNALEELGVTTTMLSPLESFPDSVFVEDPALVFPEAAILLKPGAPSRAGEAAALAPDLEARFERVLALPEGNADGGDVLVTGREVLIGLSERTDRSGAEALASLLTELGRVARVVEPPPGVLHFKTACSLIGPDTILTTEQLRSGADCFAGYEMIFVPDGEEPVANALSVNGMVLLADGFPKTAEILEGEAFAVRTLTLDNVMKLDAGLSCMSLRW